MMGEPAFSLSPVPLQKSLPETVLLAPPLGAPASSSAKEEGESATERPTGIIANCVGKKEEERGKEEKRAPDVTFLSTQQHREGAGDRGAQTGNQAPSLPRSESRGEERGGEGKFLGYHRLPPTLTPPPSRLLLLGREGGRREGGGKKGTLLSILFECSLPPPFFFSLLPSVGREEEKGEQCWLFMKSSV